MTLHATHRSKLSEVNNKTKKLYEKQRSYTKLAQACKASQTIYLDILKITLEKMEDIVSFLYPLIACACCIYVCIGHMLVCVRTDFHVLIKHINIQNKCKLLIYAELHKVPHSIRFCCTYFSC